jgi:hypothetical protein
VSAANKSRQIRAILLDADRAKVEVIEIPNQLDAWYKRLGCSLVSMVDVDERHSLVVDDEGLYTKERGFVIGESQYFAGSGLIVGTDRETGETTDCTLRPEEVLVLFGAVAQGEVEAMLENSGKVIAWPEETEGVGI